VLFLNPPSLKGEAWMKEIGRCGRKAIGGEIWPQTGLAYLAAVVERDGHLARIIDAIAEPVAMEFLAEECRRWRPDIILANSATPTIKNDSIVLARLAQVTGALCGFSGPHVSALPAETLGETGADFAVINEAEETVAELARAVAAAHGDREAARRSFGGIRGLAWKRRGGVDDVLPGIIVNAPRPLIADLDALPLPARHLLPNSAYHMPFFGGHPFATIIPTRGCPWPCTFCRAGRVWGRKIRVRSVPNVLAEIESLRRDFGIRHIVFMTDSLTLNRQWAAELFGRIAALGRAGSGKQIEWVCNSRVDAVDAEMLALMKRAGCRQIAYGLESGSRAVLDASRKGITVEQCERAIRLTRDAGIQSIAYFVLGLPGETAETVAETIRFAERLDPDYVNFHIATPFPGTELYEQAVTNGWLTSRDWDGYEEEGSVVMQAGALTPDDLLRAQRRAMRNFYLRPSRLLREIGRLRSWAELKAKARAALKILTVLGAGGKDRR
jgi:radical SAM superfamily enzyme YgiQ (UPF0313 family)